MRLRSIQALRAVAAVAVVINHLSAIERTKSTGETVLTRVAIDGAAGVDLFFVISGFVMVWVAGETQRSAGQAGRFLFARIARIYPLWWLFAGLLALYFFISYGHPWDPERIGSSFNDGLVHLWRSAILVPQHHEPVLSVGWTLVHEMYFYLVFTLLILLVPARYRLPALMLWGATVTAGALYGLSNPLARTLTHLAFSPLSIEFLFGALVAYAIRAGWRRYAWLTLSIGVISLIGVLATFDFVEGGPIITWMGAPNSAVITMGWGRTLLIGLPAALLIHGLVCLELERNAGRFIPGFAVRLGDWSYALYLSHILVLSAVARIYFPYIADWPDSRLDNAGFLIVAITSSVIVAGASYHLFETPIIKWYRKTRDAWFKPRQTAPRPAE